MADAIKKLRKRYGQENDIRVDIDPKTGETKLLRVVTVVELVENDDTEISLAIATRNPDAALGDEVIDELPPVELPYCHSSGEAGDCATRTRGRT